MRTQIPFGLKDGALVQVVDVLSGLACGCICPYCRQPLVAHKGRKYCHHFQHQPGVRPCEHGYETAVHQMAKQILLETRAISLPKLEVTETMKDIAEEMHSESGLVCSEAKIQLDTVMLESSLEGFRPDVLAFVHGKPFVVEIAVTHFSGRDKQKKIFSAGYPCVEIDLSKEKRIVSKQELAVLVIHKLENKRWIAHPNEPTVRNALRDRLSSRVRERNMDISRQRQNNAHSPSKPIRQFHRIPNRTKIEQKTAAKSSTNRWFYCESCRQVFPLPIDEVSQDGLHLPCPKCGHGVSTNAI
jgi:hypothetical protein